MSGLLVSNKGREELHWIAVWQLSWQFEVFSDERKVFPRFAIYLALFDCSLRNFLLAYHAPPRQPKPYLHLDNRNIHEHLSIHFKRLNHQPRLFLFWRFSKSLFHLVYKSVNGNNGHELLSTIIKEGICSKKDHQHYWREVSP